MLKIKAKYYNLNRDCWDEIEVPINTKLEYDYSHCSWFAIDGEFTGIYPQRDKDIIWTIASESINGELRVEMLYTYNNNPDITKLIELLQSDKEKIFWYGLLDIAYLIKRTGVKITQPIYDVKLASKLIRTYSPDHNVDILLANLFNLNNNEVTNKKDLKNFRELGMPIEKWSSTLHQYNVNDVIYLKPIADKLKEMAKFMNREDVVNSANKALPELANLQYHGFYRDIFHPMYNDTDMGSATLISSRK